jgi:hypothetical protein
MQCTEVLVQPCSWNSYEGAIAIAIRRLPFLLLAFEVVVDELPLASTNKVDRDAEERLTKSN